MLAISLAAHGGGTGPDWFYSLSPKKSLLLIVSNTKVNRLEAGLLLQCPSRQRVQPGEESGPGLTAISVVLTAKVSNNNKTTANSSFAH